MGEPATAKSPGFSARLELDGLEPLLALLRRLGRDAELRVCTEDGIVGLLRYAGGELAGGVFDGVSGPLALERVLALRSGAVDLQVLSPEPTVPELTVPEPTVPEPSVPQPTALQPIRPSVAPHLLALPSSTLAPSVHRVEATSAIVEPPALRRWLWAIAPGLALALWGAIELAQLLSQRAAPNSSGAEPRAPSVVQKALVPKPALPK